MQADGITCIAAAAVKCIEIANKSNKQQRQMIMLGDGQPVCTTGPDTPAEVLADINSANYEHISINTLYISASPEGIPLFQDIASSNNGTFTLID